MPRIKIELPPTFSFTTLLPVLITDLNYGNHMGNDKLLSFLHEARVRYLMDLGYSELDIEGVGMIMADATLQFKAEIYYGEELEISIKAMDISRVGFELVYKVEKKSSGTTILAALAKTTMICYDYEQKKVAPLPEAARVKLSS